MSHYSFYHSGFHQLQEYEAYTEAPGGNKSVVKDFKTSQNTSGSVFYDDVKETSFNFPNITQGSIGHLEHSIIHSNPHLLSPHYFSRFIPVVNGELKITFSKRNVDKIYNKRNK
ncbi:MAG: DUF3857 domain-containing protein [Chitinophagaceae bacterium]